MLARLTLYCFIATFALAGCGRDSGKSVAGQSPQAAQTMTVYKTPQCGCCSDWVDHMEEHGFKAEVVERDDLTGLKNELGVPSNLRSCHTAVIGGRVIEGHVPAKVAQRFLEESGAHGIAVPGMPVGSPGMEMGDRFQPYSVVAFDEQGSMREYQRVDAFEEQH